MFKFSCECDFYNSTRLSIFYQTSFQTKPWTLLPVWPSGSSPLLLSGLTMSLQVDKIGLILRLGISLCLNHFRILQLEELSEDVQRWQRPEGPPEGRHDGRDLLQRQHRPHHHRGHHLGLHCLQPGLPPESIDHRESLVNISPIC